MINEKAIAEALKILSERHWDEYIMLVNKCQREIEIHGGILR